ncbi:BTAD domain-containing putative transcriptional regulator [Streptomyces sp. NPDC051987]|uniref:AfsR/SARP family transcriptional regulator n=1 Tax=Streptomyces sp. NPDC051987 TaxID=3155808 RepID=UPI003412B374
MKVRLLGPVDVVVDGAVRAVPGQRRKAVLAALALQPAQVVSTDLLIEIVWGDTPPATSGNTLQSHLSFLRGALGDRAAIRARPPGYALEVAGEATDVQIAERLIRDGTRCADPREGAARLQTAVGLWRGRPLADLADLPWFDDHARRLDHLYLHAQESLIQARLALGEHAQLVTELERLRGEHPLHEEIHRLLILALYRAGRQADALATYQELRRTLDAELGIEPSLALRELLAAILRQDPSLDPPSALAPTDTAPAELFVPAQLPLAIASFSGRDRELARLEELLPGDTAAGPARGGVAVISAVSGTAGVGKTALAVHWAHRVRGSFPDGQLYVNLRGFDPGGSVADPAEVMPGFLGALGVPPARVPSGLDAQVGLYRSLLAGRRVLIVLDNARDAEQVRPLLPGSANCLALVTSRHRLTSLAVTEGAHLLAIDMLTPEEAQDLLAARLGARRVAAEPTAAREIGDLCARLPLALAIVAARAAAQPRVPLAMFAAELREPDGRLNALDAGDSVSRVREVFSWSYRTLSADAARLFRLLGLHPGPDVGIRAAGGLAGVPTARARSLMAELADGHLLTEHTAGRYVFHDLLRAYAAELVATQDSDESRRAAVHRMFDHYLHTAYTADGLLTRRRDPITLSPARPGSAPETLTDHRQALAWFTAEHPVLLAAVEQSPADLAAHAWQLASTLNTFLDRQGQWPALAAAHTTVLNLARHRNDRTARANAHRGLGLAEDRQGHTEEAHAHYSLALELFDEMGNHAGQARIHQNLGRMSSARGDYQEALDHAHRTLVHYRAVDDRGGQAIALNHLGWYHTKLGDHRQALSHCLRALALIQEIGDPNGEAHTWDSLGYIRRSLGQYGEAVDCYRQALDLFRVTGDRHSEATAFAYLGDTHHDAADSDAAYDAWAQALTIFEELGHADATPLRAKIRENRGRVPEGLQSAVKLLDHRLSSSNNRRAGK